MGFWAKLKEMLKKLRGAGMFSKDIGIDLGTASILVYVKGKGVVLREGKDITLIATGLCVSETLEAANLLEADGIDAKVINIHTIKPLDEELVVAAAKETGKVVTIEEHSVIGGLGSAVCDALCANHPTPVYKIGINDTFGESGPAVELIKKYGLDAQSIYEKVKVFVNK